MDTFASHAGVENRQSTPVRQVPWRIPWYLWLLGVGAVIAVLYVRHPSLLQGGKTPFVVLGLLFGALVGAILWELPPAVMMCGAIVLTVFSGNWRTLGLPGFPFVPDRILVAGSLLAVLLRSPGAAHVPRVRVRGVHLLMLATVLYVTFSAVLDGQIGHQVAAFALLDRLGVLPFLLFLVAPAIFAAPRERNWLLMTLVLLGAYLGLMAVFGALGLHSLVFPRYIRVLDAHRPAGQTSGPFGALVSEGFACYACSIAAAIAFLRWRGLVRWLAAAVIPMTLLGSALSLERGVWLGVVAGTLAVVLVAPEVRRRSLPVVAAFLVVAALLLALPGLHSSTSSRLYNRLTVWDRQNQTTAALSMIQAKPLFGFGWSNWAKTAAGYFRIAPNYPLTGYPSSINQIGANALGTFTNNAQVSRGALTGELHDTYLSNAVELGLVGASLWLVSVVWGLGGAVWSKGRADLRPWKLGLLAIGVCFLVVCAVDPLEQNFVQLLLWTWAGVAVAEGAGDVSSDAAPTVGRA